MFTQSPARGRLPGIGSETSRVKVWTEDPRSRNHGAFTFIHSFTHSVIHPLLVRVNKVNQLRESGVHGWTEKEQPGASRSFWVFPFALVTTLCSASALLLLPQRYHTPTRSKSRSASVELRGDSETPPHWKEEMKKTKACAPPSVEKWSKGDKYARPHGRHSVTRTTTTKITDNTDKVIGGFIATLCRIGQRISLPSSFNHSLLNLPYLPDHRAHKYVNKYNNLGKTPI